MNPRKTDKCFVIFRNGERVGVVLYDEELHVPIIYKISKASFDEVSEFVDEQNNS